MAALDQFIRKVEGSLSILEGVGLRLGKTTEVKLPGCSSKNEGDWLWSSATTGDSTKAWFCQADRYGTYSWRNALPEDSVMASGIKADGVTDNTARINAQMAALAAAQGANSGGATLVLPRGVIIITNLLIPNHVRLVGQGVATILRAKVGTTGSMIALVANHNRFCAVEKLRIDGNGQNVTGIRFNTQDVALDEYADGLAAVDDVFIHNCGVDGLHLEGRGEDLIRFVRIRDCTRYGMNIECVDNDIVNCMIGGCGSSGVRISYANNRFTNVKAFYNGLSTPTAGHGFWCDGSAGGHSATFTNCEAQDNNRHGFYAQTFDRMICRGCVADSNNAGHGGVADQNGDGFHIDGSSNCSVDGSSWNRNVNTLQQKYALGMTNGAENLQATLQSKGNASGHVRNGWHTNVDIAINAYRGEQDVAYAASITPDPTKGRVINVGALIGGITINAPAAANTWTGAELDVVLTQDATGGRVATWDSAYNVIMSPNTVASRTTVMSFVYNGSKWVQKSAAARPTYTLRTNSAVQATGTNANVIATCLAGETAIGGGCGVDATGATVVLGRSTLTVTNMTCGWSNTSGANRTISAQVMCVTTM